MPDYDPLTISDEEMKQLPASERAMIYKARRAAATGGAPPPARATSAAAAPPPAAATPAATAGPAPQEPEDSVPSGGAGATAQPARPSPPPAPAAAAPAPRPAAPPPPKEPEKPAEPPFVQRLLKEIPDSTFQWRHGYAEMKVPKQKLLEAARLLNAEGFDYLSFITEVDWRDHLELLYHLFAYDYRRQPLGAILRCDLPRDGTPEVASVTPVWPGAEFMEREAFEMMGISFLGHPDLRRILLPDDFVGFPMRRDFEPDWDYVTVKQLVRETD